MKIYWVNKIDKMILILIFGLAIYIPLLIGIFQVDQISSTVEKRVLTAFPIIPDSILGLNRYPAAFNTYYSDHFGLREQLTQAYFLLIYKVGAHNSVGEVTFGQDGWMFLGNIKPGVRAYSDPMGDVINKNQFSKQQLEKFAQSIMAIKNWLKNKGIEYIYVIAPNKHSIYFDKLPKYISKLNKKSATDQLVNYLQQNTDVHVVDLRPVLLKEKKNNKVYFKTDTHWTLHGANAAQFEIMKEIKSLFPNQVKPIFLTDNQFWLSTRNDGDLASLAKTGVISEEFALLKYKPECEVVQKGTDIFECKLRD